MKQKTLFLLLITASICANIKVPTSIGDLIDKITILQVKLEKIEEPEKRANVSYELLLLLATLQRHVPHSKRLQELTHALKEINSTLWDIENAIRTKESKKEFDDAFIEIARSVYINNGYRHALKREINILTGSRIIEEKQYTAYK